MIAPISLIIYASIYIGLIATTFYVLTYRESLREKTPPYTDKELPTVTILIPAYNEEKTIEKTIDSIMQSDYPKKKFKIILINDGSTDNTLEKMKQAEKKYSSKKIEIINKKNEGKATSMNKALKKVKSEIVFSMDADTEVPSQSMKNMVKYFKDPDVMCVSPAIVTKKPKNLLQRVQYIEYVIGLFLRKTFAALNAVHITPGAFSAYRKSFFDKYGSYEVGNITEDLELAMRIQFKDYKIQNSPESPVYTTPPSKFSHLLKQRRRWYVGLMRNMWKYKKLVGSKTGDLGLFVLPVAWISIFFAVFITFYFFIEAIKNVRQELLFFHNINYEISTLFQFNFYFFERVFFRFFSNTTVIFVLFFLIIILSYLYYASRKLEKVHNILFNLPVFFALFSVLFGFWWIVSLFYMIFHRDFSWK